MRSCGMSTAVVSMVFMAEWVEDPADVGCLDLSYFNLKSIQLQHVDLAPPHVCCSNSLSVKIDMRDLNGFDMNFPHLQRGPSLQFYGLTCIVSSVLRNIFKMHWLVMKTRL